VTIERVKNSRTKKTIESSLYSEQMCFEADRSALIHELRAASSAIENVATEMTMIAAESVFDNQVSRVLSGEARAMHRMLRELKDLQIEVARARLPKA
jgi:competence protein ComGF